MKIIDLFTSKYRILKMSDGHMIQVKRFLWPFWDDVITSEDDWVFKRAWFKTEDEAWAWFKQEFMPMKKGFKREIQL